MPLFGLMYSNLTKGEKKKKLAQARKRAILWSAQKQTRLLLKKNSSASKNKSTETPTKLLDSQGDTYIHPTDTLKFETPIPLQDERVKTIQGLEQTLKDLQDQKQAIDITIDVLSRRLDFLLRTKTPK